MTDTTSAVSIKRLVDETGIASFKCLTDAIGVAKRRLIDATGVWWAFPVAGPAGRRQEGGRPLRPQHHARAPGSSPVAVRGIAASSATLEPAPGLDFTISEEDLDRFRNSLEELLLLSLPLLRHVAFFLKE
ncbi:hypothetical protein ACJJTC_000554 [Scirpophaga incertulas]